MRIPRLPKTMLRGVGRKVMFLLFIAAAVPAMFTAGLAWFEIARGVKHEAVETLRSSSKAYGVELYSRLERATQKIDRLARVSGDIKARGSVSRKRGWISS